MTDTFIETHPGNWIMVAGPHATRVTMLTFIARLSEHGPVRVLDGGNQFNAYLVARQVRGRTDLLERISIARAFTCHQVLASLEKAVALPSPFIVLDILHSFYDESAPFAERRSLLERCIPHLGRLSVHAGGVVSVHPPAILSPEASALFVLLKSAASETWLQEVSTIAPEPPRLF